MASNLRVDNIQPSTGMGIGIGTANGSVTFNADVTGGLNVTNGSVGIGTDNPNAAKLDVRGSNNPLLKLTQTTSGIARLNIESETNDGYQYAGIGIGTASADAELMWTTLGFDVNVADSVRLRIPSSGDVQVLTGNLVIGTSGKGIDFSAASGSAAGSTSALLDDYEEGTWTPTVGGTTTYTQQEGRYTKIGRMVHLVGVLRIDTIGTGSQNIVSGLPFTNGTPGQATVNINYYQSSNATTTWIAGYVEPNTSNFRFSGNDGNATTADANISFLTASTGIWFSLTYQV